MPNLYSMDCNNRQGYCVIQDLFCKNKSFSNVILHSNDGKVYTIGQKIRMDSVSILDINNRKVDQNAYTINYATGVITFFQPRTSDIKVTYDQILPLVTTDKPNTVAVEFWFWWTGRYNVMPFGFNNYGLFFYKEYFGFTTGNNDVYGISALGLEKKWIHVHAIFDKTNINNNQIYINGELKYCKQRTGTPSSSLDFSINANISGWPTNSNYKFDGFIDEFRIWSKVNTQREIKRNVYRVLDLNTENFTGLIAYYRFDEENKVIDYSPLKRNVSIVSGVLSSNTQQLDGYNTPPQIMILNPISQMSKGSEYNMQYMIKSADPQYKQISIQLIDNGREDDTAFFVHEIDKTNWTKIIDFRVY